MEFLFFWMLLTVVFVGLIVLTLVAAVIWGLWRTLAEHRRVRLTIRRHEEALSLAKSKIPFEADF